MSIVYDPAFSHKDKMSAIIDHSDAASALNATVRGILIDTGACLAAIEGISWDMSGFTSRIEAEDMINVLRDIALRNMSILRDKKNQTFVQEA